MKRITCLILTWTLSATLFLSLPATPAWAEKNAAVAYGRQLYQEGNLNQSLAVLRSFVQQSASDSDNASAYALIGRILNRQQQYGDAILYLKRIPEYLKTAETELLLGESLVKPDAISKDSPSFNHC